MPKKAKRPDPDHADTDIDAQTRAMQESPNSSLPDAPEIHQIPTSHGPLGDVNGLVEVYTQDMSRIMLGVTDMVQQSATTIGKVEAFEAGLDALQQKVEELEERLGSLERQS
jgi:hypothetical protein